jgi:hypothetical protein
MDALARSDWAGATGLVALFQELYNENRQATLIGFAPEDQLEAARILPQSVGTTGRFDAGTRTALVGALVSGLNISPSVADSMPHEAGALGRWFVTTIVPRVSRSSAPGSPADFAWDIATVASTADLAQSAMDVRGAVMPFILGGAGAVNAPLAVDVANAKARNVVEQSGGTIQTRAVERGAGIDNPTGNPLTTLLSPMLITGTRKVGMPDWGYYAAAAGIVGLAGILAWQMYQRR